MQPIDLDHNATSPLRPEALEAMRPLWLAGGNPESRHAAGRAARRAVIRATETVARILQAHPEEIVFTSGGTEANNLAIFGQVNPGRPGHLVASPMEHPAVAEPIAYLESQHGFAVDRPPVRPDGRADSERLALAIQPGLTKLATLILAHNETGAIQPVAELADRAMARGVPVHTDAVQAVARIAVDFRSLGVATLAASGHKFGGPGGIGLLLVRRGVKLAPILRGGGQQRGLRPGSVPVPLIAGMAVALEAADRERVVRSTRWACLRDRLEAQIRAGLEPGAVVRIGPTDPEARLPQTLNLSFPGRDGEALRMQIDLAGVCASFGSACASGADRPSPTLMAMGVPELQRRTAVRFSLGPGTTEAEIDEAARRVIAAVQRVDPGRELNPAS